MPRHEFAPFDALVERIQNENIARWSEIEPEFIRVVEEFDSAFSRGEQSGGWYQSKARYFNDIVVRLLGNASGREVVLRCRRNSQLFRMIDIDICYPGTGDPVVAGEVKALGTPPHSRNRETARAASADLHKRVREVAFTSTDLKAAYAPARPIQSFQQWIDSTTPGYFSFWAIRANDDADLERVRTTLASLRSYCNGVGAVIYRPLSVETPTKYRVQSIVEISVDRALREMAQRIS